MPRVIFVDERNGVLALEQVDGWSIREVLGGGAEGEDEEDGGEGEYVDPAEAKEVVQELEGVVSEGMEALERIGVSKGESAPGRPMSMSMSMSRATGSLTVAVKGKKGT